MYHQPTAQTLLLQLDAPAVPLLLPPASPHPLGSPLHHVSPRCRAKPGETYNGKPGQILGSHHNGLQMEHVLRPEVKGFDYPSVKEHFKTEKQKQYLALKGEIRDQHLSGVKDRGEITRTLRRYEVNHQDAIREALERNVMTGPRMNDFIEGKTYRDALNTTKGGKALVLDDVSLDRKGKKKLYPVHLANYY